jgi:hypothetical protein
VGEAPAGASGECPKEGQERLVEGLPSCEQPFQRGAGGLAEEMPGVKYVDMSDLSKEELDRIREEFLEEKVRAKVLEWWVLMRHYTNGG